MRRLHALVLLALLCSAFVRSASAQGGSLPAPTTQLAGLRSQNHHGSFADAVTLPDGSLVLLFNANDGIRLLKTSADTTDLLAQTQQGAAGDVGIALSTDGAGNLYVTGTSSSGLLHGTGGTVFPSPADTTTNAFVARFDADLNLVFLTFLGVGKTEANALAVTPDAVFVTGVTYGTGFPATPGALQTSPPNPGEGNAFVERFSTDGATLRYATFLDAPGGTVPEAILADGADYAYIAGSTAAPTFPIHSALQPAMLGDTSGFVTQLSPDGASVIFSTFLAGSGITSLALDPASGNLLLSGTLDPAHLPLAFAAAPVVNVPYQAVLRLSADGQAFLNSTLLLPGNLSYLQPASDGSVWVTGSLALPLPPAANVGPGDAYALHLTATGVVDKLLRLGGSITSSPAYATLQTGLATPTLSPDGRTVYLPGIVGAHTAPALRPGQTFDLALNAGTSTVVPNTVADLLPSICAPTDDCSGSGGLLAVLTLATPAPFLALSTGDTPNILLRNTGAATASALVVSATGDTATSSCSQTIAPNAQCTVALAGTGPGTLSVTAANTQTVTVPIPAGISGTAYPLAVDTSTLDFGIVTAASPQSRTITVTNMSASAQSFVSAALGLPTAAPYTLAETSSTCPGPSTQHTLPANTSCSLVLTLTASSASFDDGPVHANWAIGSRSVPLTGYAQSAELTLSAKELDFGSQPTSGSGWLPRYLYLSNNSDFAVTHAPLSLPPNSPFTLLDNCPATLASRSTCNLAFGYNPAHTPTYDSLTVNLDGGLSVLLTGEALPTPIGPKALTASPLTVSSNNVTFPANVPVTGLSTAAQTVTVTNTSSTSTPLTSLVLGDFAVTGSCDSSLGPGASCTLSLTFTPALPGTRLGLLLITGASGTQPVQVTLVGTATSILDTTDTTVDLGQTVVGEPLVTWIQLQGTFPQLTAATTGDGYSVALLADDGTGHGTLPDSAFAPTASAPCSDCWLAVRYLPITPGLSTGTLHLLTAAAGSELQVALQSAALPASGLIVTPAIEDFGVVNLGTSSPPVTFALTNLLPQGSAAVQQVTVSGDFTLLPAPAAPPCKQPLAITAACGVSVAFSPADVGRRLGSLHIVTDAGSVTASLTGTGALAGTAVLAPVATPTPQTLAIFPAQADFGSAPVNSLAGTRRFTLTNATSAGQKIAFATSANFPFSAPPDCPTLAPGATCTVDVIFLPQTAGPLTGSVIITATREDGSPALQSVLYLRGYGTASGTLTLSSGMSALEPLDFGTVPSGSSASANITVSNTGPSPVNLRRLTSTAPFQVATTCTTAIDPGGSCTLSVTYFASNQAPNTAPRTDTGTLLLESDASGSPETLYLTATAAATSAAVPPLAAALPTYTLSQGAITFGNTRPGQQSSTETVFLINNGAIPVTVSALQASAGFSATSTCSMVPPAGTCPISLTFQPTQQAATSTTGSLTFVTNGATYVDTVTLLGSSYFTQLQLGSDTLNFGSVPLGSFAQRPLTLTNPSALPITLSESLTSGDYLIDTSTCLSNGTPLAAGATCTALVTFTPSTPGTRTGTLTLSGSQLDTPQIVALTGVGLAGHLQSTPTSVNFGTILLGNTGSQSVTLTNTGNAPVGSLALQLMGAQEADFQLSSNCGANLSAGASCTLSLAFTPSIEGSRTGTLSIASTDPASPLLLPITAAGSRPPGFALTVNGASTGSATIASGASAKFPLMLTPWGGYKGTVALTCKPIAPAPNATCMLGDAQLGPLGAPTPSSVTLVTFSGLSGTLMLPFGMLCIGPLTASQKGKRGSARKLVLSGVAVATLVLACTLAGCGNGSGVKGNPYTPPGIYGFEITATSMGGTALVSTVTLTLTVK